MYNHEKYNTIVLQIGRDLSLNGWNQFKTGRHNDASGRGGDKSSQTRDIEQAKTYWQEYKETHQ